MSSDMAISVSNVSKVYKVYSKPIDMFWEALSKRKKHKDFHALNNISFQIQKGEVVGVMGRNGSGKSTLLKILAGTLNRTNGRIEICGKVAAILELGTGFHPEYSGRENIYMGGICLGMSRHEISDKIQSIIEFSELEEVIDQPFKTYSSGMQARLTFSVAVSVSPDIFIIDEALAAGDSYFVSKCLVRIREICMSGATVMFVSHSVGMIEAICSKAIWLEAGSIMAIDTPRKVVAAYEADVFRRRERTIRASIVAENNEVASVASTEPNESSDKVRRDSVNVQGILSVSGSGVHNEEGLRVIEFEVLDANGDSRRTFRQGETIIIRIHYKASRSFSPQDRLTPCIRLTCKGVINTGSVATEQHLPYIEIPEGLGYFEYRVPENCYGCGEYVVSAGIVKDIIPQSDKDISSFFWKAFSFSVKRKTERPYDYTFEPSCEWRHVVL